MCAILDENCDSDYTSRLARFEFGDSDSESLETFTLISTVNLNAVVADL